MRPALSSLSSRACSPWPQEPDLVLVRVEDDDALGGEAR